jgi:hypothetical protein
VDPIVQLIEAIARDITVRDENGNPTLATDSDRELGILGILAAYSIGEEAVTNILGK